MFHAGTELEDGMLVTSGGRVLGVTAILAHGSLREAIDEAYRAVDEVSFAGMHRVFQCLHSRIEADAGPLNGHMCRVENGSSTTPLRAGRYSYHSPQQSAPLWVDLKSVDEANCC